MVDVEAALVSHLAHEVGVPCYADVPRDRPDRFATVELLGSTEEVYGAIDHQTVAVQSWANTTYEASELARWIDRAMFMATNIGNVWHCERTSLARFPDPDSRTPRYQGIYVLVTT